MRVTLRIWRQRNAADSGHFEVFQKDGVVPEMSFLEMLDALNRELVEQGKEPVAFESDCREGICGTCSLVVNGIPHGPGRGAATCQLYMRRFRDGDTITVEPFRAKAFPVLKDLIVDRSAFDRIIQAGGFVSVNTGGVPDANAIPIPKDDQELAMDAAACIGCGACVAACKNASAHAVRGGQGLAPWALAPGPAGARNAGQEDGGADGQGRLRRLHQHLRVRSSLPGRCVR